MNIIGNQGNNRYLHTIPLKEAAELKQDISQDQPISAFHLSLNIHHFSEELMVDFVRNPRDQNFQRISKSDGSFHNIENKPE